MINKNAKYWMAHADKFPGLCTPDESYHEIFPKVHGQAAILMALSIALQVMVQKRA
jgi:hypothetical protein